MKRLSHFLFASAIALTGCADHVLKAEIEERVEHARAKVETAKSPASERPLDPLEITNSVWLGDRAVALQRGTPLPSEWEEFDSIALRSDNPLSLSQVITILSAQTKIPFRLTGGAEQVSTGSSSSSSSAENSAVIPAGASTSGGSSESSSEGMIIAYEGKLSGLLDLVTGYYNVHWSYDGNTINISRYETRTFVLDALPGAITVTSPEGAGATGDAASSASAEPLATASIDIWEDISGIIGDLVGEEGSVTISQSSGTVVVSTTRDRMERVAAYIQQENLRLSRQVAVNIEMYTVDLSDEQDYALDMQPEIDLEGWLGEWLSLSYSGVPITSSDIAGANVSIGLVKSGGSAVFQALNSIGTATRIAQIPITTLNNRPAMQRIATDRTYISETSVTVDGDSGTTTTEVSTDTAVSGISVSILPRLMTDDRMLLQYALAQGTLVNLATYTSPDMTSSVQLPETQGISFSQQVMMKNGSTLILAGFDQSDADDSRSSPMRGLGWLFGGTKSSVQSRRLVVIAITPREIVVSSPEAS